jgi:WD40 repeat protein
MAFSPVSNLLAWGTRETTNEPPTLTVWDAGTRREVLTVAQPDTVTAVAFSPDGKLLATFNANTDAGVPNASVNLWQTDSGALVTHFPAAKGSSSGAVLRFFPDGNRLAVGETTGRIRLLDWRTGQEELLQGPREGLGVSAMAISPDGRLLAASCAYPDFAIGLWDMATLISIGKLEGHRRPVSDLAFAPDSRVLFSASEDGTIRFWNVREMRVTQRLQGHLATVNGLAVSPDGRTLLSAGKDGTVRGWDAVAQSHERAHVTLPTRAGPYAGAFTADGRNLITASKDDPVIAWDLETGQAKESWPALGTNSLSVAVSPDGRWLVVGDWAGVLKIWDRQARQLVTNFVTLPERPLPVYALTFLTPERALYSAAGLLGAAKLTVQRWEPPSWREVPIGSMDITRALWWAESPSREWQAFPDWDGRVQVWDLANDRHVATLQAHSSVADTAGFSPDGRWLATGGRDGLIKLWQAGSWRLEATLQAHLNLVGSLSFSPDGTRLLTGTGSADEVARLWDLGTRRTLLRLGRDGMWTSFARFSPDGNTLVAIGWFGKVEVWHAPTFEEIERRENGLR